MFIIGVVKLHGRELIVSRDTRLVNSLLGRPYEVTNTWKLPHVNLQKHMEAASCESASSTIFLLSGCMSKIRTQTGILANGNMDQNLRSISWWFNLDPYPSHEVPGMQRLACHALSKPRRARLLQCVSSCLRQRSSGRHGLLLDISMKQLASGNLGSTR